MTRANKALAVFVVTLMGLWGCARPSHYAAQAERLKTLEARCAKLEEDYRSVAAARDSLRKKIAGLEEEQARERAVAKVVVKERDELKQVTETRAAELAGMQTRFDRLRKGIEALMTQDAALAPPAAAPAARSAEGPEIAKPGQS